LYNLLYAYLFIYLLSDFGDGIDYLLDQDAMIGVVTAESVRQLSPIFQRIAEMSG